MNRWSVTCRTSAEMTLVGSFVSRPAGLDPGSGLNLDYLGFGCSLLDPHTSHQSWSSFHVWVNINPPTCRPDGCSFTDMRLYFIMSSLLTSSFSSSLSFPLKHVLWAFEWLSNLTFSSWWSWNNSSSCTEWFGACEELTEMCNVRVCRRFRQIY